MHGMGPSLLVPALGHSYASRNDAAPVVSEPLLPEPVEILPIAPTGSRLMLFVRSDSVVVESGAVADMPAVGGVAYGVGQPVSGNRPTLVSLTGLNATVDPLPAVRFDGTNDNLFTTIAATAARGYMWLVARAHTLVAGTQYFGLLYNAVGGYLSACRMTSTVFTGFVNSTDGADLINGPARDTNIHLFEASFETSGVARFRVDGVAYNGVFTGTIASTVDGISLGCWGQSPQAFARVDILEAGYANFLPSNPERVAIRAYVNQHYGLSVANA